MNAPSGHESRSEKTSGRRRSEGSREAGHGATWREVDARLELRERQVAILDTLDEGDVDLASANLRLLLDDLDREAA